MEFNDGEQLDNNVKANVDDVEPPKKMTSLKFLSSNFGAPRWCYNETSRVNQPWKV